MGQARGGCGERTKLRRVEINESHNGQAAGPTGGADRTGGFRTNQTDSSHTNLETNTQPAPPQTVAPTFRKSRLQTLGGRRDIMRNGKEPT